MERLIHRGYINLNHRLSKPLVFYEVGFRLGKWWLPFSGIGHNSPIHL